MDKRDVLPGRQTNPLSAKAVQYDDYRMIATNSSVSFPLTVPTLLQCVGWNASANPPRNRFPSRIRERFEKALDSVEGGYGHLQLAIRAQRRTGPRTSAKLLSALAPLDGRHPTAAAEEIGIDRSLLSRIEQNKRTPS